MPKTIDVVNPASQVGETEAAATAVWTALGVVVAVEYVVDAANVGLVKTEIREAIPTEEEGGPVGSLGAKVTLIVGLASTFTSGRGRQHNRGMLRSLMGRG